MTDEVRLLVMAAAPTLAVIMAAIFDRIAHRRIDRKMDAFHSIISNGNELRKLKHQIKNGNASHSDVVK